MFEQLWAPIVAVTAAHRRRENGLISSTAVTASLLPESHELVRAPGVLALQFLPDDGEG